MNDCGMPYAVLPKPQYAEKHINGATRNSPSDHNISP